MNYSTTNILGAVQRTLSAAITIGGLLLSGAANAAVHGITGGPTAPTFNLTASASTISQPDGANIYAWGYGCTSAPTGFLPASGNCPLMQMPGPTMIVTEGDTVTVTLTNALPLAAGNTSILFPGMVVTALGGVDGVLTKEAPNGATGNTVTYSFIATKNLSVNNVFA
jgi:FtsP/CotA-like multicopper oxidase with cupredoxin domain